MLTEQDYTKIARALKVRRLRSTPGMDEVAVALNAKPTYDEVESVRTMAEVFLKAGYEIKPKV